MKLIHEHFLTMYSQKHDVVSATMIQAPQAYHPLMDGLDFLLLVILENNGAAIDAEHIQIDGKRAVVRAIRRDDLETWIAGRGNRNIIEWIVRGEILVDSDGYLAGIREQLLLFPDSMREQKKFVEFVEFLRTYLQAKQDLTVGNLLDAYSHVLSALHHWAHIVLIEEGIHPELAVWSQLKCVHPGVYKLYEELTISSETLEQRVQLVILACEFTVMNKMKSSCSILFDIMESRNEPWSVVELETHSSLKPLCVDLSLVIQKLVTRAYIKEVVVLHASGDLEVMELQYMIAN